MPIPFRCPHCGVTRDVPDRYAGQSGNCASCQQPITIPVAAHAASGQSSSSAWWIALLVVGVAGVGVFVVIGLLVAMLVPALSGARSAASRVASENNLKSIGLAMHQYHEMFRSFPAASLSDPEKNMPPHSWRITILPNLGYRELYEQYDLTKPWDHPDNLRLESRMPREYGNPRVKLPDYHTNYLAIVGDDTVLRRNFFVRMSDVHDGTSHTVMIVESTKAVHWMAPDDLDIRRMTFRINGSSEDPGLPSAQAESTSPSSLPLALYASGSVALLEPTDTESMRSKFLCRDGR